VDEDRAVKAFRPVLRRLRLREQRSVKPEVFLADFPQLDLLDLDLWSIHVMPAPLVKEGSYGMFALVQHPKAPDRTLCCLFIESSLYDSLEQGSAEDQKRDRLWIKHIGVHEFVHFIAWVYVATTVTYDVTRAQFMKMFKERLRDRVDAKTVKDLLNALKTESPTYWQDTRFNDSHFRIKRSGQPSECELKYDKLYLALLFSRELFEEEWFTKERQQEVLSFGTKGEQKTLIGQGALEVADEKSVLSTTAEHRLATWIEDYFK
jgi:hypothetical protein